MSTTEMPYKLSAIEGASSIGLMVVLFDTLAGDLRRAAAALNQNDIETRAKEFNHALLVIAQLNSWVDLDKGGDGARNIAGFYAYLRAKVIEAVTSKSAKPLDAPIEMILQVRTAWQKLDVAPQQGTAQTLANPVITSAAALSGKKHERISSSKSR